MADTILVRRALLVFLGVGSSPLTNPGTVTASDAAVPLCRGASITNIAGAYSARQIA